MILAVANREGELRRMQSVYFYKMKGANAEKTARDFMSSSQLVKLMIELVNE